MKVYNQRIFYFLVLLGVIGIQACVSDNMPNDNIVFKYNQPNPITSLDPAFAKSQNNIWAVNHLYEGLVRLDDSLNIVPSLAKSWEINSKGDIITFHLRQDVMFHANKCFDAQTDRVMKASDVRYSLLRLLDADINSPGSWLFADKIGEKPLVEVINDSTLLINLKAPFMPILGILSMQYCSIVSEKAAEYYGESFRSNPVGTGPFKMKRWVEGQALFLERNFDYYVSDFDSNIEYIKISHITEKQIALYELLRGNIDLISGLESSFSREVLSSDGELKKEKSEKLNFIKSGYLNTEYLGINLDLAQQHKFLSKKEFRQALNYSIDKHLMIQSLRNNLGIPATEGFIPHGLPGYDSSDTGYSFNPKKAKELLQHIKYDGSPIIITTNNEYLDVCTFVARQWKDVGINVDIEVMESASLREGMRNSQIQLFRASWIADYPDAESFLCMYYSKNPAPPNYTRFRNKGYDELYEIAIQETNINKRIDLYRQMNKILIDEAPVIFLFYDQSSVFTSKRVKGYSNNALNLLNVDFDIIKD